MTLPGVPITRRFTPLRLRLAWSLAVTALLLPAGCGGDNEPQSVEIELATDAAIQRTVSSDGGTIEVADVTRSVGYRLSVPAGALSGDLDITVTPISEIEHFPFDGGLLGGLQFSPEGQRFFRPVTLEIFLNTDQVSDLNEALDDGMLLFGFHYQADGNQFSATPVGLSDDHSVVTLQLHGFSGAGAAPGNPVDPDVLARPDDPAAAAQQDIIGIIYEGGVPADLEHPLVRAQLRQVLLEWFNDGVFPQVSDAVSDPAAFDETLADALEWHAAASAYSFLSSIWFEPADDLAAEALVLKSSLNQALITAVLDANQRCTASGTVSDLERVIELDAIGIAHGLIDETASMLAAANLNASSFCLKLTITSIDAPDELEAGTSTMISFRLASGLGGTNTTVDLAALGVAGTFAPRDNTRLGALPGEVLAQPGSNLFEIIAIGTRVLDGSYSEGTIDLGATIFGGVLTLATETVVIDVTESDSKISCSGDPTIINSIDDEPDRIAIIFDGASSCRVAAEFTFDEDDQDIVIELDTDPDESGWDDSQIGSNWVRNGRFGDNVDPDTHTLTATRRQSGQSFSVTFTVDVSPLGGGSNTTMTVRDVSIRPR